jgi:hypothetical protein
MGCTLDKELQKQHFDKSHENRHGRRQTIDTRKASTKVADTIIENVQVTD